MFIIRHPKHRTGVHTCAVTTSSGTLDPLIPAILDHSHNSHRGAHRNHAEVVAFIALSGAGTIEHNFLKSICKDQGVKKTIGCVLVSHTRQKFRIRDDNIDKMKSVM